MKEESIFQIAKILTNNKKIEILNLKNNLITTKHFKLFRNGIASNNAIKYLNLQNCGITDESLKFISQSLIYNKTIKNLDLSNNNFNDNKIFKYFKSNTTLKILNLSNCKYFNF
jgi:Ran GTPase-activating protein (RanGAP) involved in mRNA processing and transport